MTADTVPPKRGRGRPPMTDSDAGKARERILQAVRQVFARGGYHEISVEQVIAEAGVSRPTFYRYFHSVDEAVELLVSQVNQDLIQRIMAALASETEPAAKVEAAVLAWRSWGEDLGEFLRPFFGELHDPHSPVGRQRQLTIGVVSALIAEAVVLLGRARPSALRIAVFIDATEYLGYHYHLNTPRDAASWSEARDAVFRLAIGLLGDASDWGNALDLARDFHVNLKGG